MAIKIKNSTIIDDSRNIVDAGISTITSLSIGSTEVISSSRQLKNIDSLDATTTATIEAAITNAPNTFTDLNVTGISTFGDFVNIQDDLNVSGVSTFASDLDINASIDVDGHTELDDLNVSGVSTFLSDLDINASVDISSDLNVSGITTSVILNVGVGGTIITTTEDGNVGLGTTNPISKLDVNGTINLNTSGEDILFSAKNPAGRTGNLFIGGGGQNVTAGVNPWNGANNLAIGKNALSNVTTGGANFAFGTNALQNLTSATDNIAIGNNNGFNLTYGSDNILLGNQILLGSTSASKNILIGRECLKSATTGESNVILGYRAGFSNTSGNDNIAFGESALNLNTTGSENISLGFKALFDNVSGSSNISIGGYSGATTNRSRKILIGWGNGSGTFDAPKDADNQLAIGQRTGAGAASYWIVGNENYDIGIGTTNPTARLDVQDGDLKVGTSQSHGIILTSPDGTQYRLVVSNTGVLSANAV